MEKTATEREDDYIELRIVALEESLTKFPDPITDVDLPLYMNLHGRLEELKSLIEFRKTL